MDSKVAMGVITCLSVLAAIASALMIIFTISFRNNEIIDNVGAEDESIQSAKDKAQLAILIVAIVTILISLMGCLFWFIKTPFFAACYGLILLPAWVILIAFGGLTVMWSNTIEEWVNDECPNIIAEYHTPAPEPEPSTTGEEPAEEEYVNPLFALAEAEEETNPLFALAEAAEADAAGS